MWRASSWALDVVELWDGDVQLGEVSRSTAGILVELYGHPSGGPHLVPYDELRRVLDAAVVELRTHEQEGHMDQG
jgi:hypothetical protein